jgi:hypothetical protein
VAAAAPVRCSAVSSHRPEVGWALRLQLAAVEAAPHERPRPRPAARPAPAAAAACGASRRVARDAYMYDVRVCAAVLYDCTRVSCMGL